MKPIYSISADKYIATRPSYGDDIYNYISSLLNENNMAWDCACGSGQATKEIAKFVNRVVATDPDDIQLKKAPKLDNVRYLEESETVKTINDQSVDLITVATGIHWLNRGKFYKEAERVLKKNGVLATWGYTGVDLNPEIDDTIKSIVKNYLMPYYPKEILIAFNQYKEIELPMNKFDSPNFEVSYDWDFETLMNYISSFTAMQRYKKTHGKSGVALFRSEILDAWGGDALTTKKMTWELHTNFTRK
jgi:ubiquinone/menaquinone biosynthesis C-methylase UbiE